MEFSAAALTWNDFDVELRQSSYEPATLLNGMLRLSHLPSTFFTTGFSLKTRNNLYQSKLLIGYRSQQLLTQSCCVGE